MERGIGAERDQIMAKDRPRIAVRAIIVQDGRLLLVNAWPNGQSSLMCAPGGGVEPGQSLPENVIREVMEETGLQVKVGAPCLVNEFHDPERGFHQVDLFFHCTLVAGPNVSPGWEDPEGIVTQHRWVTEVELAETPHRPLSLGAVAFQGAVMLYDPLEKIVK